MTESTSVDQRDSRITSDPASFDRFAELVDAGKVPKIDLTTCIGDARPSIQNMKPSQRFQGLHTQRLSVGCTLQSAGVMPKIMPDCEYDRRKNASHDKKAWWSRPTALVKHLPDAFRASQQASQAAAHQPISLVSNASR